MRKLTHLSMVLVALFVNRPLVAEDKATETPAKSETNVAEQAKGSETWMFFSKAEKTLEGIPIEMATIDLTIYGERVAIPLSAVRGIRFGEGLYDVCTVKLMNGDTLNGAIERQVFRIGTDWGEVQVDRQRVSYFVRSAFAHAAAATVHQPQPSRPQPVMAPARESLDRPVMPVLAQQPLEEGNYELQPTPAPEATSYPINATPNQATGLEGEDSWIWGNGP